MTQDATKEDAVLGFELTFEGAPEAGQNAVHSLSANYPLSLTLFEGQASTTFTASEGTVEFHDGGGRVAAFMNDETGRKLFVSARFAYPEEGACSESYRFCFEADEVARVN